MVFLDSENANYIMKVKSEPIAGGQHLHDQQLLQPPALPPQAIRRDSISLSDYYSDEPNDMDYNEVAKISQYRQACEMIVRRCEALTKDNEKLVRR